MPELVGLLVLGVLTIVQSVFIRQVVLLQGSADIVMLMLVAWALQRRVRRSWVWILFAAGMVAFLSAVPFFVWLGGYLAVTLLAAWLRRTGWRIPAVGMLGLAIAGTFLVQMPAWVVLRIAGTPIPFLLAVRRVILPSMLLNLLFALPVYSLASDLASWVFPANEP
ncbi:MAG: hypothetical protein Fur0018_15830 [Anaerolineales bacterium]